MSDGIYSALSGAIAQQRSLDVVANNVANANTVGFQADRVAFREALAGTGGAAGGPAAAAPGGGPPPNALRYVAVSEVARDTSAGSLRQTGNALDVALQGSGYFAIETPAGERYTRAGSFIADAQGIIRTRDGDAVVADRPDEADPSAEPPRIRVPQGTREISIGADGTVSADGNAIGRFRIVAFADERALTKQGQTLYATQGGAAPTRAEGVEVVQGAVEMANVNAVAGMNELITVSRSFEAFQKVIQAFRQLDERTARELGSRT